MDCSEQGGYKFFAEAELRAFFDGVVEDLFPAAGLKYGYIIVLFVFADFHADAHTLGEGGQEIFVKYVDFGTQLVDAVLPCG